VAYVALQQTWRSVGFVGMVLKNSEAKNKTFTRIRYFLFSRANLSFMPLSNAKFLANRA
jgi:hypothetical protein